MATRALTSTCLFLGDGPANADTYSDLRRYGNSRRKNFGTGKTSLIKALDGTLADPEAEWKDMVAEGTILSGRTKDDIPCIVSVGDTGGGEDYPTLRRRLTALSDIAVLVVSLDDQESADAILHRWLPSLEMIWGDLSLGPPRLVVAANKCDLYAPPGEASLSPSQVSFLIILRRCALVADQSSDGELKHQLGTFSTLPEDVIRHMVPMIMAERVHCVRADDVKRLEGTKGIGSVVVCSAVTGDGVEDLRRAIVDVAIRHKTHTPKQEKHCIVI